MNELLAQDALKLKQNENQFLIIIPIYDPYWDYPNIGLNVKLNHMTSLHRNESLAQNALKSEKNCKLISY